MNLVYYRNILFTLFLLYNSLGVFDKNGSIIAKISVFSIFIISILFMFKTILSNGLKEPIILIWSIFLSLNVFGFAFTGIPQNQSHFEMIKNILFCLLPFYPFYYFSTKGIIKDKHFVIFLILMIPISIGLYESFRNNKLANSINDLENITNNISYLFVRLLPFVLFIRKNTTLSHIIVLIIMYFIIISAKRGAIITSVFFIIFYFGHHLNLLYKNKEIKKNITTIVTILILIFCTYYIYKTNEFTTNRMITIIEGNSSDRDIIFKNIWQTWLWNNNIKEELIGFGFASSLILSKINNFAHNDWLEILSSFGFLGVLIYFMLFIFLIKFIYKNNFTDQNNKIIFICVIFIWFFISLFSMSYTNYMNFLLSIIIGYIVGSEKTIQHNNI